MRFLLLSGLLLLISIVGCKKSSQSPQSPSLNAQVNSNWQLQLYVVGIGQVVHTTPDSVVTLSLGSGNQYTRRLNGQVYETGTYSLANVKAAYSNQLVPGISFSSAAAASDPGWLITLEKDTLTLVLNVQTDGGFLKYTRAQ